MTKTKYGRKKSWKWCNKGMLFFNKDMLFVNKGMLFVNKGMLFVNKGMLFVNKGMYLWPGGRRYFRSTIKIKIDFNFVLFSLIRTFAAE